MIEKLEKVHGKLEKLRNKVYDFHDGGGKFMFLPNCGRFSLLVGELMVNKDRLNEVRELYIQHCDGLLPLGFETSLVVAIEFYNDTLRGMKYLAKELEDELIKRHPCGEPFISVDEGWVFHRWVDLIVPEV